MSDNLVTLRRLGTLVVLSLHLAGCGDGDSEGADTVRVTLRPDAVEPAAAVEVSYSIDSEEETPGEVSPGEEIELGSIPVGAVIRFSVTNANDAGRVRANILIDNCFRDSTSCEEPGCTTTAEATALIEECLD